MLIILCCLLGFFVLAAIYCTVLTLMNNLSLPDWKSFDERFPPLTDEEFLAKCQPGTDPEIAFKVRDIIADCLSINPKQVYPEARLIGDLGAE
ncbi:MAG: hypothetical protein O2955_07400 [Planctomycetota bacterium]|nr:hypothetical protein [Planctomycetota bacterium]MDA1212324.1 hypothetical protein [Planctomycetota bacterium]